MLLAVVQAVVTSPTPSPSPEVITVVKTVTALPNWAGQLGQLALLAIPGVVASKLHDFVNPKLGTWANTLLLFGYSVVLGVAGLAAAGQLDLTTVDWSNPEVVGTAIFTVLGAAAARYAKVKATESSKGSTLSTEAPTNYYAKLN